MNSRRMLTTRQRMIDARKAAREGRRFHAFYRGYHDGRAGKAVCPYSPGSEDAICWENGRRYQEDRT